MDPTGPDGAPRDDGNDLRWSSDYLAIVTGWPDAKPYLLPLLGQAIDQGKRGGVNPWLGDVDSSRPEALWLIVQRVRKAVKTMTHRDGWGWGG